MTPDKRVLKVMPDESGKAISSSDFNKIIDKIKVKCSDLNDKIVEATFQRILLKLAEIFYFYRNDPNELSIRLRDLTFSELPSNEAFRLLDKSPWEILTNALEQHYKNQSKKNQASDFYCHLEHCEKDGINYLELHVPSEEHYNAVLSLPFLQQVDTYESFSVITADADSKTPLELTAAGLSFITQLALLSPNPNLGYFANNKFFENASRANQIPASILMAEKQPEEKWKTTLSYFDNNKALNRPLLETLIYIK